MRRSSGLGMVVGLLVSAGCSNVAPPSGSPVVVARSASPVETAPSATPTVEPSDDCVTIAVLSSAAPPTTDWMSRSELIAPGTVDRIGPAEWNTPGNVRPEMSQVRNGRSSAVIWRPVQVTFEPAWKGTLASVTRTVLLGGTVGCDAYTFDFVPQVAPGTRWVLFLGQVSDSTGKASGTMSVFASWPIDATGLVRRPVEEPIALAKLRGLLSAP